MHLPSTRKHFPVRVPFETSVDLYKMGRPLFDEPEEAVFEFDLDFEWQISEKLAIFQEYSDHSNVYLKDDLSHLEEVYWRVATAIAEEHPQYFGCDETGFESKLLGFSVKRDGTVHFNGEGALYPELGKRCYEFLQTQAGIDRVGLGLALSVQEDIVVMRNLEDEPFQDVAESLLVALPSHWNPLEKLGQSFGKIHQPVGDNERLLRSHPRLVKAMIQGGPFFRYNWSLASLSALCQNPVFIDGHSLAAPNLTTAENPAALLDMLFFRVERQTFLSYPDLKRGLFFIRIYQQPLTEALTSHEQAERLADAVESMTPAQREYRSMLEIADTLIDGLRAFAAT